MNNESETNPLAVASAVIYHGGKRMFSFLSRKGKNFINEVKLEVKKRDVVKTYHTRKPGASPTAGVNTEEVPVKETKTVEPAKKVKSSNLSPTQSVFGKKVKDLNQKEAKMYSSWKSYTSRTKDNISLEAYLKYRYSKKS